MAIVGAVAVEPVLFILMLAMIAASALVYIANDTDKGYGWAHDVCSFFAACDHMYWLFAATVIMIVVYFVASRMES
jgi:hypothetical protein